MNAAIENQILIKAYFVSSPVNSWPEGLCEVDTNRLGDSKLRDMLVAAAVLANAVVSEFMPETVVTVDNTNFISNSSPDQVYFSAVMTDRPLIESDRIALANALYVFCSRVVERAEDIFNQSVSFGAGLAGEYESFVDRFVAEFMAKKNGARIKDPFVLEFPPIPVASGIAVQGKFLPPALIEKKVATYVGVAKSDGGQVSRKMVHLELIDGIQQKNGALLCSVDDEAFVRLACEAAGDPARRLHIEADELENGRGQRRWVLRKVQWLPDDNPENFDLQHPN